MSSSSTSTGDNKPATPERKSELQVLHLKKAFMELLKEQKEVPSITQVAERAGISKRQAYRHWKKFEWKDVYGDHFRSFTPDVLTALLLTAKKGNPAAIKLWMELVEGWRPVTVSDFTTGGSALKAPTIYLESINQSNAQDLGDTGS